LPKRYSSTRRFCQWACHNPAVKLRRLRDGDVLADGDADPRDRLVMELLALVALGRLRVSAAVMISAVLSGAARRVVWLRWPPRSGGL
jgi:hypothetical protein